MQTATTKITNSRALITAQEAIEEAWAALDIRLPDVQPDRKHWDDLKNQFAGLLVRAYAQNHNGRP